ncbi:MAG: SDR family NAD(P)-dependent oxidoreductase [Rhodobacteraceae bacterium]|nr:SDR family NAD(P)-dependent oxidoreductase [Paracoccaceae bacterium]
MNWTPEQIQDQSGKTFLITGANTGLGYETALELAKKSAHVILAGRSEPKLVEARARIAELVPAAQLDIAVVDLNSIAAVKTFTEGFVQSGKPLDVLINNAGIMFPPPGHSADGFEAQFGVNFIGHYVLTALLFPVLKKSKHGRVVTLSSMAHRNGKIDFGNFKLEKPFEKFREYGQSKVADLIFSFELQRRIGASGGDVISTACHPGVSKTELLRTDKPEMIETVAYMDANQGSFSTLFAATEAIEKFAYIGPDGEGEVNGYPAPAFIAPYAKDAEIGTQLWAYAEKETGVTFEF